MPASLSKRGLGSGVSAGFHSANSSNKRRAGQQPLGQQDLAGREAREIAGERRLAGRRQREGAGRQIEPGEADLAAGLGEAGEVIVPARVEQTVLGQRPGGDEPHHGAPHRAPLPRRRASAGSSIWSQIATLNPARISRAR